MRVLSVEEFLILSMGQSLYDAIGDIRIPRMVRVRQIFEDEHIEDIEGTIAREFSRKAIRATVKPKMSIALTVGSRPICRLDLIIRSLVSELRKMGASPFVIPAMGSHGGGTAEGQLRIIQSYGITEENVGCPVKSTMETVCVGKSKEGHNVHVDRYAFEADGIIVIGKIRPHTGFDARFESGLMKMMAIGLGKQHGASVCHNAGAKYLGKNIPMLANVILEKCNILFALGIIENAYHHTHMLKMIPAKSIPRKEPSLLKKAYGLIPLLKFKNLDVLVVDEIGKNISGDGMDPYISKRPCTPYIRFDDKIQKIAVLDLSVQTHGGMLGAGMADVCTRRLFDKSNLEDSYVNAVTSTIYDVVKIPMILKNDYYAIAACIRGCVEINHEKVRMVRIHNTLDVNEIEISESMLEEALENPEIEVLSEPYELQFDKEGNLRNEKI